MSLVLSRFRLSMFLFLVGTVLLHSSEVRAAEPQPSQLRQLSEFGDVGSKQLAETFHNAIAELRKSGGVLSLSQEQWKQLRCSSNSRG